MLMPHAKTPESTIDDTLQARVRAAAQLLEEIGHDRGILARVSAEDRKRILNAVGLVFSPDINARRRLRKEAVKRQKALVVRHEDRVYAETGIRKLRRETVFTTPNVFPSTSPDAIDDAPHIAELIACCTEGRALPSLSIPRDPLRARPRGVAAEVGRPSR